ncbi:MAG TPA: citrate/2-methylcitrate synthase [Phycisphaerae bacterium]|nr:citrate/2-methylcitrate synthase [Phycisphaerae bacterium]
MPEEKFKPGLEGIYAGQTTVAEVTQTGLRYRGYDIADLAQNTCFEEVAHALLHGDLPTKAQLAEFRKRVQAAMRLPDSVASVLLKLPKSTPPMDALRSAVSLLGHIDPEAQDNSPAANLRKSERLLGQLAAALGIWCQHVSGVAAVAPDADRSHGANLLAMMTGNHGSELAGRVMDGTLILYAEHEFNASTFTARTIASTLADMHSAVTGAIGALKGPLHGGANEAAMRQFLEIGKPENVEKWFRDIDVHNKAHPDKKKLIMGFGHRVYKHGDHRAGILREWSLQLSKETGQGHWIAMADKLQELMLKEKNIHPNTDYPAAHAYYQMGIPIDLFTPIFVCARITGWCAHIMEQHQNNRIIRPLSEYLGPALRKVVPIDKRG